MITEPSKTQQRKTRQKLARLTDLLRGRKNLLIVMQDNPDPDSIAAAMALRRLAHGLAEVPCTIAHGGTVGRAENRALVAYLNPNLHPMDDIRRDKFDLAALVDTQPRTGNNSLQLDWLPNIVFDHHHLRQWSRHCEFTDIRSRYGATVTILLEYLNEAGIVPEMPLATAMLYAIRSDTQDLGREAIAADIRAVEQLYPLSNMRMLGEIQKGSVPRSYFQMLANALQKARYYECAIVTDLGPTDNPDMIGEVADLLLREEKTWWTLCTGRAQGKLLLSIRTCLEGKDAARIARRLVARRGTGGGHLTFAGGQIPLLDRGDNGILRLERDIRIKFLHMLGIKDLRGQPVVGNNGI
jgi:nanoRNase/pAp phosphatase (c-di-AMP/oligoRNAs hydrolase)